MELKKEVLEQKLRNNQELCHYGQEEWEKIPMRKSELMHLYESMSTTRITNSILYSVLKEMKWNLFAVGTIFYMDFFYPVSAF